MYRSALVATDGSETADSILAHVANVVEPSGTVYVLAVVDDLGRLLSRVAPAGSIEFGGNASVAIADDAIEAEKVAAREHIADAERILKAAGMTHVEGAIVSGAPGDAIVSAAKAGGAAFRIVTANMLVSLAVSPFNLGDQLLAFLDRFALRYAVELLAYAGDPNNWKDHHQSQCQVQDRLIGREKSSS